MVWVDFLSTLEVNLGIICVSLPMLGPLVSRYNNTRGASKLGKYDQSEQSGQSGSKLSGRRKRLSPDTITLQSIYDYKPGINHAVAVLATYGPGPDGSETHHCPCRCEPSAPQLTGKDGIVVESKWEIHRS